MKIDNFSNYEIYPNEGKIFSYKTNRWVGAKDKRNGYWQCTLYSDDGKRWDTKVHRVIWIAVNGEIPNGLEVNHRDENPSNNTISNLNLLTRKENINYGTRNLRARKTLTNRKDQSKTVGAFKNGILIMTFPSTQEAHRNGYKQSHISQCCNGLRKTHQGFQWQYLN